MRRQHRLRRLITSSGPVRRGLLLGALGIIALLGGLALSFQMLVLPVVQALQGAFENMLLRVVSQADLPVARHYAGGALLILGAYVVFHAGKILLREVMRVLNPGQEGRIVETFFRQQVLASGPAVVAIGGGTGLSTLLRGIKHKTNRITAIVAVTDDGGSSGRLVADKKILPPGDIRNCLVALADAEKSMTDLFQHRFEGASGSLSGHSTGNLLIAAMVDLTGDFDHAVQEISKVLAIRGRVIPATLDTVTLRAEMEDGSIVCGESAIVQTKLRIRRIFLEPEDCTPVDDAMKAISEADVIVFGPGSVYTSVIPPLLVPGIAEAISEAPATKVYVCNVMTQPGETDRFTASDHVHAIEANVGRRVFDNVLINKATPSRYLLERYAEVGQDFVVPDPDRIRALGLKPIAANLISETDVVRHDPMRVAEAIMRLTR
jgi:uncharacterized cofD-like protein